MSALFTPRVWEAEIVAAYKANATRMSLGKMRCDTCARLVLADRFWTKTTCRKCYVGARQ